MFKLWVTRGFTFFLMFSAVNAFAWPPQEPARRTKAAADAEDVAEAEAAAEVASIADCQVKLEDVVIRVFPQVQLVGLRDKDLAKVNAKDRKLIIEMRDYGAFDDGIWDQLPVNDAYQIKTWSKDNTFMRTNSSADTAPEFVLNGKTRYLLPLPSSAYRGSAKVSLRTRLVPRVANRFKLVKQWLARGAARFRKHTVRNIVLIGLSAATAGTADLWHQSNKAETEQLELAQKTETAIKLAKNRESKGVNFLKQFSDSHFKKFTPKEMQDIVQAMNDLQCPNIDKTETIEIVEDHLHYSVRGYDYGRDPHRTVPAPHGIIGDEMLLKYVEMHPMSIDDAMAFAKLSILNSDEILMKYFETQGSKMTSDELAKFADLAKKEQTKDFFSNESAKKL